MRLRADQPEAAKIQSVLLNGRPVPMVFEVDDTEGWVKSYVPIIPQETKSFLSKVSTEEEEENISEEEKLDYELVQRFGVVTVRYLP